MALLVTLPLLLQDERWRQENNSETLGLASLEYMAHQEEGKGGGDGGRKGKRGKGLRLKKGEANNQL